MNTTCKHPVCPATLSDTELCDCTLERIAYLNPWISVEKELPKEGQQVLLFIVYQRMIGGVYCEDEIIVSGGRKDGDWFVGNDMMMWDYSFNLDFTDDDVTHWMIPNPPKE